MVAFSSIVMLNLFQHLTPHRWEILRQVVLASSFPSVQNAFVSCKLVPSDQAGDGGVGEGNVASGLAVECDSAFFEGGNHAFGGFVKQ